jgi:hypothetical protein
MVSTTEVKPGYSKCVEAAAAVVLQKLGIGRIDKEMKSYATYTQVIPSEVCLKVEDEQRRILLEKVASNGSQTIPTTGPSADHAAHNLCWVKATSVTNVEGTKEQHRHQLVSASDAILKKHMTDALSLIYNNRPFKDVKASVENFLPDLEASKWQTTRGVSEDFKKVFEGFRVTFRQSILDCAHSAMLALQSRTDKVNDGALDLALKDPSLTDNFRSFLSSLRDNRVEDAVTDLFGTLFVPDFSLGETCDIFRLASNMLKNGFLGESTEVNAAMDVINDFRFLLKLEHLHFQLDHITGDDAGLSKEDLDWISTAVTLKEIVDNLSGSIDIAPDKLHDDDVRQWNRSLRLCILACRKLAGDGNDLSAIEKSLVGVIDKFAYFQTSD